jgi:peptidoglycan/xylan/chitin deacetylase (PgdA/CDA1 family)
MHRPVFILSLDCEGKWGIADRLRPYHYDSITNRNLMKAYMDLLHALERADLKATFAFTGALSMTPDEYRENVDRFGDSPAARAWLEGFQKDVRRNYFDGWFAPELLKAVVAAGQHEIGSHGFTHICFDEKRMPVADAKRELEAVEWVSKLKGVRPQTFVYPRNVVGYRDLLRTFGYIAFRSRLPLSAGTGGVLLRVAREFGLLARAHPHSIAGAPVAIPPGYFLNWRFGVYRYVPAAVTLRRWKRIVDDAVENDRVVLLWLHPDNLMDGYQQLELLQEVLNYVSVRVHDGRIDNCTQSAYVQTLPAGAGRPILALELETH